MSPQAPDVSPSSYGNNDDMHDLAFAKRGCCWIPFLTTDRPSSSSCIIGSDFWQRIKPVDCAANGESWWFQGWMKIREWSELVAGPKWKTFLRRFNKKPGGGNPPYGKFQYDPSSYALNFDEGARLYEDNDLLGRGFSSRFSLPPSCKSSMDFDREGLLIT
ncbi:NHL DOMAIN PROTEIN [Salix koriyanagi]|uniref:NHL DOMAIN PROTEIN n=1 Tax=Salix koriyanagi TaxID=2511006 RepID=A0A9Q0T0D2_9ROSI|nr:NHL DOMAIN PROTEIN [Salix koriyanagi]